MNETTEKTPHRLLTLVSKLQDSGAIYVLSLRVSSSHTFCSVAKVVDESTPLLWIRSERTPRLILPQTSYVRIAMYRLPLEGVESASTKCPTCKNPTEQEYVKVTPASETEPVSNEEAMNLLKLTKRLILCTECGTLRLIN